MLICQRFREAAIHSPSLWAAIDATLRAQEWYDMCLQRAGNHKLDVYGSIEYIDDEVTERTCKLISRSSRLRLVIPSLDVTDPRTDEDVVSSIEHFVSSIEHFISRYLQSGLPLLREFEIFNETLIEQYFWLRLDRNFLGGSPHSLAYLLVDGCIVGDIPLLPSLRKLILRTARFVPSCTDLQRIFLQSPQLAFLRIQDPGIDWESVDEEAPSMNASPTHVHKQYLEVVQVVGELHPAGHMINIIGTPSSELSLLVHDKHDDENEVLVAQPSSESSELSRKLYGAAIRFLDTVSTNSDGPCHVIEMYHIETDAAAAGCVTRLLVSPDDQERRTYSLNLRLVMSTNAEDRKTFDAVLHHCYTFVVPRNPSQVIHFASMIISNANIHHAIVHNTFWVRVLHGKDMSMNQTIIGALERMLSQRASDGCPLRILTFRFAPMGRIVPSYFRGVWDAMSQFGEQWKAAGWIQEVKLVEGSEGSSEYSDI